MTGPRTGPRIEAAFLAAVGVAVAASWLRWHHLALLIIGVFIAGIGTASLYTTLRRSPAHRRQDAMIRGLWSTVKRWPAGQSLTDPVTGDELTVERERGFLILAIRDADTGQISMVTRYLLGWLAAPNPPPLFRHTTPAGEPSPVRMSLNQAGALLAFNQQTGAMEATDPGSAQLDAVDEARSLDFLSYYFNQAQAWGREVVTTYKDGYNNHGEVYDFERGGPADLTEPYWLTDDSVSSTSWCYTAGIGYYSAQLILHSLIDRVSKGGNMLLNIAPMADGSIPREQKDLLLGIGDYLGRFGESIYATRAWTAYGEGPTAMGGGSFITPAAGTARDIRFTRNKTNTVLYATVLGWPGSSLAVTTLNADRIDLGTLTSAQLLGGTAETGVDLPARTQDASALTVTLPAEAPHSADAYVLKLVFSGQIPTLRPATPGPA